MKILNFGSCNIDTVYTLSHIVRPGETLAVDGMEQFVGGKGLNQSVALANAGATVYHAGLIGEDGGMLRAFLENAGVDTRYLKTVSEKTGQAVIQVDKDGQNSIFLYAGANHAFTETYVDEVLADFGEGDFLVLQNEINLLPYIVDAAFARGMKIFLNPAPFDDALKAIDLKKLYYIIPNEIEAAGFSGDSDPLRFAACIREKYPHLHAVVTLGSGGSMYVDAQQICRQAAYTVPTVDTTAAGDTFVGYFIAALSRAESIPAALRFASAASALTVSKKGAAPSIPLRAAAEQAMETLSLYTLSAAENKKQVALRYLCEHLADANLKDLSALLHYVPTYTAKWIKQQFHMTFSALLQQKRCRAAAEKLMYSDLSVQEIIRAVGYENESFFRRMFTEQYGCSPAAYRKKYS